VGLRILPQLQTLMYMAVDTVLPPQSLLTGALEAGDIEGEVWGKVRFLDEPCCKICGFPFDKKTSL